MDSPLCLLHGEHIAPVKQTEQEKKKLKTTEISADIGDRNNQQNEEIASSAKWLIKATRAEIRARD